MQHPPKAQATMNPPDLPLTPQLEQAIASLRLDGIVLSDQSLADLSLFSQGQMSKKEVMTRVLSRVRSKF